MGSILATRYRQCLCGIGSTLFLLIVSLATYHSRSASERAFAAQRMKDSGGSEEQIRQVQNDNKAAGGDARAVSLLGLMPIGAGAFPGHRAAASPRAQREETAIAR